MLDGMWMEGVKMNGGGARTYRGTKALDSDLSRGAAGLGASLSASPPRGATPPPPRPPRSPRHLREDASLEDTPFGPPSRRGDIHASKPVHTPSPSRPDVTREAWDAMAMPHWGVRQESPPIVAPPVVAPPGPRFAPAISFEEEGMGHAPSLSRPDVTREAWDAMAMPHLGVREEPVASRAPEAARDLLHEVLTFGRAVTPTFNLEDLQAEFQDLEAQQAGAHLWGAKQAEKEWEAKVEAARQNFEVEAERVWKEEMRHALGPGLRALTAEAGAHWDAEMERAREKAGRLYDTYLALAVQHRSPAPTQTRDQFIAGAGLGMSRREYVAKVRYGSLGSVKEQLGPREAFVARQLEAFDAAVAEQGPDIPGVVRGSVTLVDDAGNVVFEGTREEYVDFRLGDQRGLGEVARSLIPIYGTVKHWHDMPYWARGVSVLGDLALVIPGVGLAAQAGRAGVVTGAKGLSLGARAATAGGTAAYLGKGIGAGVLKTPGVVLRHPLQAAKEYGRLFKTPFTREGLKGLKGFGGLVTGKKGLGVPGTPGVAPPLWVRGDKPGGVRAGVRTGVRASANGGALGPRDLPDPMPRILEGDVHRPIVPGERAVPHRLVGPDDVVFGGEKGYVRGQRFAGGFHDPRFGPRVLDLPEEWGVSRGAPRFGGDPDIGWGPKPPGGAPSPVGDIPTPEEFLRAFPRGSLDPTTPRGGTTALLTPTKPVATTVAPLGIPGAKRASIPFAFHRAWTPPVAAVAPSVLPTGVLTAPSKKGAIAATLALGYAAVAPGGVRAAPLVVDAPYSPVVVPGRRRATPLVVDAPHPPAVAPRRVRRPLVVDAPRFPVVAPGKVGTPLIVDTSYFPTVVPSGKEPAIVGTPYFPTGVFEWEPLITGTPHLPTVVLEREPAILGTPYPPTVGSVEEEEIVRLIEEDSCPLPAPIEEEDSCPLPIPIEEEDLCPIPIEEEDLCPLPVPIEEEDLCPIPVPIDPIPVPIDPVPVPIDPIPVPIEEEEEVVRLIEDDSYYPPVPEEEELVLWTDPLLELPAVAGAAGTGVGQRTPPARRVPAPRVRPPLFLPFMPMPGLPGGGGGAGRLGRGRGLLGAWAFAGHAVYGVHPLTGEVVGGKALRGKRAHGAVVHRDKRVGVIQSKLAGATGPPVNEGRQFVPTYAT